MKVIQMKKSVYVLSLTAAGLLFGSVGVFASSGLERIQAYLNHDIKFTVNGTAWTPTDSDGNELSALIYEGSSYVPAKAVAEKMGGSVKWDGDTQTIKLTTPNSNSNAGIPYKDGQGSSNTTPKPVEVSGGIWSFPGDFEVSKVDSQVKEKALQLLRLYADALTTGDTSGMERFVKTYASNDGYTGWEEAISKIKEKVAGARSANNSETLEKYAQTLKSATVSDLKIEDSFKAGGYGDTADFSISFKPEDWDLYSTTWVYFRFTVIDDKDGRYLLDNVAIIK